MKPRKPKIKLWDIETSHNLLLSFSLLERNMISHKQIMEERYIISAAFRDWGTKGVRGYGIHEYDLWDKDPHDDWAVVSAIHEELSDCDAIVAHYGNKFDLPFFNGRALFHGLPPIPPIIQIDTYQIAKKAFKLNSNRLDYIAKVVGVEGKIPTNLNLWLDVWKGDVKAASDMLKYNMQDVNVLNDVFERIKVYAPSQVNHTLFLDIEEGCAHCGSEHIHYRGYLPTRRGLFRRFQCQECGAWGSHAKKEKNKSQVK